MKIGLFFGSFNPIHVGHLIIANHFVEYTDLKQIWFVVTPQNPLKQKESLLQNNHRLQLVKHAIADHPKFKVSDIEFKLEQPNYTVKSLAYLKDKYPKHDFVLLMGTDNLNTLHKWKNYEVILENYQIYCYPRPGEDAGQFAKHKNVLVVNDVPLMQISATYIRNSIKQHKSIEYLLPEKALQYLREMHFYEK